jgi:hypothetical protein
MRRPKKGMEERLRTHILPPTQSLWFVGVITG